MTQSNRLESLCGAAALIALVGFALQPSLHGSLSGEDFPGHVALLQRFLARLGEPDWLPLWTSEWSSGTSLLLPYLHPIAGLLPLAPFALAFGPELGLRVGDACFLVLAGLAMGSWCRSLGVSRAASWLGGLFYALHPSVFVFLGRAGQVHQPVTMAVVPLIFLAFRRLAQEPRPERLLAASLATAALALDMQRFWLLLPFLLLAYLATPPMRGVAPSRPVARIGWAAAAGGLSALLLCFPVLPALLERPALMGHPTDLIERYRQSFPLPHLLALLDRDAWLSAWLEGAHAARSGVYAGNFYQGLAPMALVFAGALRALRGAPAPRGPLALVSAAAAVALALAMGTRVPLRHHGEIVRQLWEAPFALVPWLALCFTAASAGLALALCVGAARRQWPARAGSAGLAVAGGALLLGSVAPFLLLARLPLYAEVRGAAHFAFPLLPFLLGTATSLAFDPVRSALPKRLPAAALAGGLALLHVCDLLPYRALTRPSRSPAAEAALRGAFRQLADARPGRILTSEDYAPLAEMLGVIEARKPAAWSWIAWASRDATGELLRYGAFGPLAAARRGAGVGAGEFAARAAGIAHVRYLARVVDESDAVPEEPAFRKRVASGGAEIYENLRALPFAQFYPRLALVSGTRTEIGAALVQLAFSGVASYVLDAGNPPPGELHFDYAEGARARALAPGAAALGRALRAADADPPSDSPCVVVRRREPELVLRCGFPRDGYLVIAESWAPGWRAEVDGGPRGLHRLNLAFQGFRVTPADRKIRIRYAPSTTVYASLSVSALAWLSVAGFYLRRWLRRSR